MSSHFSSVDEESSLTEKARVNHEKISDRISIVLNRLGISQSEFSRKTGVSTSALHGLIKLGKSPTAETLSSMTKVGLNINWLLTGEGEMFMPKPVMQEQKENTAGGAPVLGVKDRAPQPIGWREFNKALEGFLSGADENSVDLIIRRLHIWLEANRKD